MQVIYTVYAPESSNLAEAEGAVDLPIEPGI